MRMACCGSGRRRLDAHPGYPQEMARELLHRLFTRGRRQRVAGRGAARRVARLLQRRWDDALVALPPDLLLTHLLEEAPCLWQPELAGARRSLAGEHRRGGSRAAVGGGARAAALAAARRCG